LFVVGDESDYFDTPFYETTVKNVSLIDNPFSNQHK